MKVRILRLSWPEEKAIENKGSGVRILWQLDFDKRGLYPLTGTTVDVHTSTNASSLP